MVRLSKHPCQGYARASVRSPFCLSRIKTGGGMDIALLLRMVLSCW